MTIIIVIVISRKIVIIFALAIAIVIALSILLKRGRKAKPRALAYSRAPNSASLTLWLKFSKFDFISLFSILDHWNCPRDRLLERNDRRDDPG